MSQQGHAVFDKLTQVGLETYSDPELKELAELGSRHFEAAAVFEYRGEMDKARLEYEMAERRLDRLKELEGRKSD